MLVKRGLSQRRSCALVELTRASFRYEARPRQDEGLRAELKILAWKHKRYGYRRAWALLRREGRHVNLKRIRRLWREEALGLPKRPPRVRGRRGQGIPLRARFPDHVWTYDFMQDATEDGRRLKLLTIIDEYTRECVAIRVERRMPAHVVVEALRDVLAGRPGPKYLRSDNGPEFIAELVQGWLRTQGIRTHYIAPASPWQNAYGESFNDKVRGECLNLDVFWDVEEAQRVVEAWRRDYNTERPHSSLGYRTPKEFREGWPKGNPLSPALGSLRSRGSRAAKREFVCQT